MYCSTVWWIQASQGHHTIGREALCYACAGTERECTWRVPHFSSPKLSKRGNWMIIKKKGKEFEPKPPTSLSSSDPVLGDVWSKCARSLGSLGFGSKCANRQVDQPQTQLDSILGKRITNFTLPTHKAFVQWSGTSWHHMYHQQCINWLQDTTPTIATASYFTIMWSHI